MSDYPFFQFYPADWIQDTQIMVPIAKAAWIDLLCQMWISPTPGKITWNTLSFRTYLRLQYIEDIDLVIAELSRVAELIMHDINGQEVLSFDKCCSITIISRRMIRDWEKLTKRNEKYKRYNEKRTTKLPPTNHPLTTDEPPKYHRHISEVRSHISESPSYIPPHVTTSKPPDPEKMLVKELRSENGPEPISDPLDRALQDIAAKPHPHPRS